MLFPAAAVLVFTAPAGAKLAQARAAGLGVPQGAWHQVGELVGSGTVGGDSFGGSVALSGGTALAGAPGHAGGTGEAYVFQEGSEGWHQVAELVGSGTAAGDNFGGPVAVSGGTAVVGAPGALRAYVFRLEAGAPTASTS